LPQNPKPFSTPRINPQVIGIWIVAARPDDTVVSIATTPDHGGSLPSWSGATASRSPITAATLDDPSAAVVLHMGGAPDPDESIVTIDIRPAPAGGSDVRLVQLMPADRAQHADGAAVCWNRMLRALGEAVS
jgi:hypothetical protein